MRWHPLRLVGGSGGTNSFSFFQSSVSCGRILPRLTDESSRVSVSITLLLVTYWIVCKNKIQVMCLLHQAQFVVKSIPTSVREARVCLMTTLLLLVIVAQIEIASPGT